MKEIVTCWYKLYGTANWKCGFFHQWSQSYEEFESGLGHFPAAVVEDAKDCQCHVVYAGFVSFSPDDPDLPLTEEQANQSVAGRKFEPRLVWVASFNRWLVQVHPETIEVFNDNAEYICQVRWISGKMDYCQGGLPLEALELVFRKANA
jgi:hypothetical protein